MGKKADTTVLGKILTTVIVLAILGALCALIYSIGYHQSGEKFTEFYILNQNSLASDYPEQLKVWEEAQVLVGIINRESEVSSYRIEVSIEGVTSKSLGPIVLQPDEKNEQSVGVAFDKPGEKQKVEFILYKGDTSYRQLYLLVDVSD